MKPVGLLVDTVYDNAGDKAIRLAAEKFLGSLRAHYEVVNPLEHDVDRYSILLIGGGHLIRDPGDAYYDKFRVAGKHILNTVGVLATKSLDYLNDYAYVSVRAEADRDRLSGIDEVVVAPCISMLLEGAAPRAAIPSDAGGLHFTSDSIGSGGDIASVVSALRGTAAVCVPFTHYSGDEAAMRPFSELANAPMLPYMEPEELLGAISKVRWLVSSSLHATIFAYMSNVPFLAYDGGAGKIREFCVDRGLHARVFGSLDELADKLPSLLEDVADFSQPKAADARRLRAHCEYMRDAMWEAGGVALDLEQWAEASRIHDAVRSRDFIAARHNRRLALRCVELREQCDVQKAQLAHKTQLYDAYFTHSQELEEQVRALRAEVATLRGEVSKVDKS